MAQDTIEVKKAPTPAPTRPAAVDVFQSFRSEMDRLFDQFWRGFGLTPRRLFEPDAFWSGETAAGGAIAAVDVSEDDRAFHITADLPGMTEKDINVTLSVDSLLLFERLRPFRQGEREHAIPEACLDLLPVHAVRQQEAAPHRAIAPLGEVIAAVLLLLLLVALAGDRQPVAR